MHIVVLLIITGCCAIGWLMSYISSSALIRYIRKNGYPQPSDDELKECTRWAIEHLLKK